MRKGWKLALFWILGTICIMVGSMISGHLEKTLGVTDLGYFLALLISFVLFLLGGLLWISVAIALREVGKLKI